MSLMNTSKKRLWQNHQGIFKDNPIQEQNRTFQFLLKLKE